MKLSYFKSGAAVISPEKRGFQTHSARASGPAVTGVLAVFNSKPLQGLPVQLAAFGSPALDEVPDVLY